MSQRNYVSSLCRSLLIVAAMGATTLAAESTAMSKSKFVLLDEAALAKLKARLKAGDADVKPAFEKLRASADDFLAQKPPAVTDKKVLPVGDDPHDYMSLAIYFWPDPKKPDGKPYMNRDGVVNRKEVNEYDAPRKDKLINGVRAMAMAYYFFDEPKYAEGASKYLHTWFLDEKTKMNPNLNHGQFVPGSSTGRGYGLIETRAFPQLCDAVTLLDGSAAWSAADRDGFRAWIGQFIDWMQTSKIGLDEYQATNNHGEWYDAQLCGMAAYLGRDDVIQRIANEEGPNRIAPQVEVDGSLPKELARTKSMHYTQFAMQAWMIVARVAKPTGVNLYDYKSDKGAGLRTMFEYMTPYLLGEKKWEHQTMGDETSTDYVGMWHEAAKVYGDDRFEAVSKKFKPADATVDSLLAE